MDIITLLITIVIVGVVVWLIKAYVPMDPAIRKLLTVAAVVVVVVLLLSFVLGTVDVGGLRVAD